MSYRILCSALLLALISSTASYSDSNQSGQVSPQPCPTVEEVRAAVDQSRQIANLEPRCVYSSTIGGCANPFCTVGTCRFVQGSNPPRCGCGP